MTLTLPLNYLSEGFRLVWLNHHLGSEEAMNIVLADI